MEWRSSSSSSSTSKLYSRTFYLRWYGWRRIRWHYSCTHTPHTTHTCLKQIHSTYVTRNFCIYDCRTFAAAAAQSNSTMPFILVSAKVRISSLSSAALCEHTVNCIIYFITAHLKKHVFVCPARLAGKTVSLSVPIFFLVLSFLLCLPIGVVVKRARSGDI